MNIENEYYDMSLKLKLFNEKKLSSLNFDFGKFIRLNIWLKLIVFHDKTGFEKQEKFSSKIVFYASKKISSDPLCECFQFQLLI